MSTLHRHSENQRRVAEHFAGIVRRTPAMHAEAEIERAKAAGNAWLAARLAEKLDRAQQFALGYLKAMVR